jgi:hypothetical protein
MQQTDFLNADGQGIDLVKITAVASADLDPVEWNGSRVGSESHRKLTLRSQVDAQPAETTD